MQAATQTSPEETTPSAGWQRLGDPVFTSLDGRTLRFTVELDLFEQDYALIDATVVVETFYGSPCCEVVSITAAHARDKASAVEWARANIDALAEDVRYR